MTAPQITDHPVYLSAERIAELGRLPSVEAIGEFLLALQAEQFLLQNDYEGSLHCARQNFAEDDCVIDDLPILRPAERGVWVNAWVYVANDSEED